VTFIDKSGERLLRAMSKKGAEFVASGMYTKHVLDMVKTAGKGSLSKLLACLFTAFLVSAMIRANCVRVGPEPPKTNAEQHLSPGPNPSSVSTGSNSTNGEGDTPCPQNW
jgi:hypothetical protein